MDKEFIEQADTYDPAAARELRSADSLAKQKLYTEAILRLGRSVEAGIYTIGRLYKIDLTSRKIDELAKVINSIHEAETHLIRKANSDQIEKLEAAHTKLTEAIDQLIQNPDLCLGTLTAAPRSAGKILSELIYVIDDASAKNVLKKSNNYLRAILDCRNDSAHAAPDGSVRENGYDKYEVQILNARNFFKLLFDLQVRKSTDENDAI